IHSILLYPNCHHNTKKHIQHSSLELSKSIPIHTMSMIRNILPRMGLRRAFFQPTSTSIRYQSTGGYGDQGGDPISNNPQDQRPRPRIDTEHPGPEPVAEGRGKSGVKGKPVPEETHGTASANSGSMSNAQASAMHRASRFPKNTPPSQN